MATPYDSNPYVLKALEFMKTHDLSQMPAGKHVIDGDNLWVNIVDADLKTPSDARLEAHESYIDVQVPLSGPDTAHAPLIGEGRIHKAIFKARVPYKYREAAGRRFILSIDNHQEITAAIAAFCAEKGIRSGSVSGLAAIKEATFRFLNPATKQYVDKTFTEQMEVCSLTGNVSEKDGKVYLHIHVTASRSDYSCIGGHLLTATVNGACELFVEDYGLTGIGRRFDPETGLNLYDF